MSTSSLAQIIDEDFEGTILETLAAYATIECVSPVFDADWSAHGNLDRAAELLVRWCEGRLPENATIEIVKLDGRTPLIYAEIPPTNGAEEKGTTLIYGHFDKQPALGPWREGLEPFQLTREGDKVFGRGTADDGYAVFSAFSALRALSIEGTPRGRVIVMIEGSEESGSPDLDAYVAHLAERIGDVGLVICLDSGCATYDRLWLTTSLRGLVSGELRVDVLDEGVHSGLAGGIVPSSFRIARELLSRIEDEASGAISMDSVSVTVPEYRRDEIQQIAAEFGDNAAGVFPAKPSLKLSGSTLAERIENGTWRAALEIVGASGIPAIADAGNVLRPFTSLKVSLRIPPTSNPDHVSEELACVLCEDPPSSAVVRFVPEQNAAGWDAPQLLPWLEKAINTASTEFFGAAPRAMGMGGSIPFIASLADRFPSAQFLVTGVLGPQSNAHGPNEFLHLPTAKAVTATVARVLSVVP